MDYISTTPLYDSNYLAHYGVLGMKWGIRHNYEKAWNKAVKKRNKLWNKGVKPLSKALSIRNKGTRLASVVGYSPGRQSHIAVMSPKNQKKYDKYMSKTERYTKKALAWEKKMEGVFGNTKMSEIGNIKFNS